MRVYQRTARAPLLCTSGRGQCRLCCTAGAHHPVSLASVSPRGEYGAVYGVKTLPPTSAPWRAPSPFGARTGSHWRAAPIQIFRCARFHCDTQGTCARMQRLLRCSAPCTGRPLASRAFKFARSGRARVPIFVCLMLCALCPFFSFRLFGVRLSERCRLQSTLARRVLHFPVALNSKMDERTVSCSLAQHGCGDGVAV